MTSVFYGAFYGATRCCFCFGKLATASLTPPLVCGRHSRVSDKQHNGATPAHETLLHVGGAGGSSAAAARKMLARNWRMQTRTFVGVGQEEELRRRRTIASAIELAQSHQQQQRRQQVVVSSSASTSTSTSTLASRRLSKRESSWFAFVLVV